MLVDAKSIYVNKKNCWFSRVNETENDRYVVARSMVPNLRYILRNIDKTLQNYYAGDKKIEIVVHRLEDARAELEDIQQWLERGSTYVSLGENDPYTKVPPEQVFEWQYDADGVVLIMHKGSASYYYCCPTRDVIKVIPGQHKRILGKAKGYKEAKKICEEEDSLLF